MATLTVNPNPGRTPLSLTQTPNAATGGDKFLITGKEFVAIYNTDVSSHTVTFAIETVVDGNTPSGKAITVPATTMVVVGPFPTSFYKDTLGFCNMTYDSYTHIALTVFKSA